MTNDELYNVWVGGTLDAEGVCYHTAQDVYDEWTDKGYEDVVIEKINKPIQ